MPRELMLIEDVDGLGIVGDVVTVANGYARNFLLPKDKAAPATEALKSRLAERRAKRQSEMAEEFNYAEELAKRLEGVNVTIKVKVSPEGKLYGSVGGGEIAKAAKSQGVVFKKEQVHLKNPLRETGIFDVPLKLHRDVMSAIKVTIESDGPST